jgi:4-hydroxy-L-threonine phosphate dehydrogenase PdxA
MMKKAENIIRISIGDLNGIGSEVVLKHLRILEC